MPHAIWTEQNKATFKTELEALAHKLTKLVQDTPSKININTLAVTITNNIAEALTCILPQGKHKSPHKRQKTSNPQLNTAKQNKSRLLNQLKAANIARVNTEHLWKEIHTAQKNIIKLTNTPFEFNNTKWWAKLTNIGTPEEAQSFWAAQKRLKNNTTKIFPAIIIHEGKQIEGTEEIFKHIQNFYIEISENKDKVAKTFARENGITEEKAKNITKTIEDEYADNTRHTSDDIRKPANYSNFSKKDLQKAISKSKNNKSPGYDNIPSECLKNLDDITYNALLTLLNWMWDLKYTPPTWQIALTTLLHKKGPESNIANYRPITLLTTLLKVWERLLKTRLALLIKGSHSIPDAQMGSQKISSAYLAILIKRILLIDVTNQTGDIYSAQIDMNKAYNRVNRTKLWNILKQLGIQGNLWECIISTYSHAFEQIIIGDKTSTKTKLARGIRQGSVLSPILYIIYTSPLIINLFKTNTGVPLHLQTDELLPCIMFVDDLETFALTMNSLLNQWYTVRTYAIAHESVINCTKSSATSSHKVQDLESLLEEHDIDLRPTKHCVVLGTKIYIKEAMTTDHEPDTITTDVSHRITATAIVRTQMRNKGLREGAINAPAAIFITKISIPTKLTFGLSSLGLTTYSKLRLRQSLATFIYDIMGINKPSSDPLWALYDTGLPDPVNIILMNELSAYVKASKGFLNILCKKIITNCDPLKANLVTAAFSWGTSLASLLNIRINDLHHRVTSLTKKSIFREVVTDPRASLNKFDLQIHNNTPVFITFDTPHHLIPSLLRTRHNILFNFPDTDKYCSLCNSGDFQTYTHFITTCLFPPIRTERSKLIAEATDPAVRAWIANETTLPLAAILGGPRGGHPIASLKIAQTTILRLLQKVPFNLLE